MSTQNTHIYKSFVLRLDNGHGKRFVLNDVRVSRTLTNNDKENTKQAMLAFAKRIADDPIGMAKMLEMTITTED